MLLFAHTGEARHPKIVAVQLAKLINLQCGGAVITPWEIEQLEEEWLDVFEGLAELPNLRAQYQAFDQRLAEIRSQHPTYRKYGT